MIGATDVTAPRNDFHEPFLDQARRGFADRSFTHVAAFGDLQLGEFCPGEQVAADDGALDSLVSGFGQRLGGYQVNWTDPRRGISGILLAIGRPW